MAEAIELHEGDVFTIPAENNLYGYGQLVAIRPSSISVIVFGLFTPVPVDAIEEISNKQVLYLFGTDADELKNQRWKIIGNTPPPANLMLPLYKVGWGASDQMKVLSYRGEILRDATETEIKDLDFERSCDPRMLEKTLQAERGLVLRLPWMDEYKYKPHSWWVPYSPLIEKQRFVMTKPVEHAVIVNFNFGSTNLSPIFKLEKELEKVIGKATVGEYDGNEVATDGSDGFLYMYGPNADKLFSAVEPVLKKAKFMKGARVTLRYGSAKDNAREKQLILD